MISAKANRLLKKLRRVQLCPDGKIMVDWDTNEACTFDVSDEKRRTMALPADSKYSLMNELYESGDVEPLSDDGCISQVTGKGWHRFELNAKKITWEFIRSIFCPIIVALLTSLLVGFFKG